MRDVIMVDMSRWDQSFVDDALSATTKSSITAAARRAFDVGNDADSRLFDIGMTAAWFSTTGSKNGHNHVDAVYQNGFVDRCPIELVRLDRTTKPTTTTAVPNCRTGNGLDVDLSSPSLSDVALPPVPSPSIGRGPAVRLSLLDVERQASCRQSTSPLIGQSSSPCPIASLAAVASSPKIQTTSTSDWSDTPAHTAYSRVASFLPAWDMERLEAVYRRLAVCGFYFGRMSIDEATEKLARCPVGTFLLRDSSDPRYLFSLSVQTCRGTTSIRMAYRSGLFRLDCSPDQEHLMPTFDCALRLVAHYVRLCAAGSSSSSTSSSSSGQSSTARPQTSSSESSTTAPPSAGSTAASRGGTGGHGYVLLESSGRRDTPVLLTTPYRERPSSLAHLCRRTVNGNLRVTGNGVEAAVDRLQLLPSLKTYLKDYPYGL